MLFENLYFFVMFFTTTHWVKPASGRASALLWVNFHFSWVRSCQEQATCAQPEALGRTNRHTITKKL